MSRVSKHIVVPGWTEQRSPLRRLHTAKAGFREESSLLRCRSPASFVLNAHQLRKRLPVTACGVAFVQTPLFCTSSNLHLEKPRWFLDQLPQEAGFGIIWAGTDPGSYPRKQPLTEWKLNTQGKMPTRDVAMKGIRCGNSRQAHQSKPGNQGINVLTLVCTM